LIEENLQRVLETRGAIGLVGLVGLVWSASGVFSGLAYNINLAWSAASERSLLMKRLVALGMIGALTVLLILSLILDTLVKVLTSLEIPMLGDISIYESGLWTLFSNLTPWVLIFILYLALYRWTPTSDVNWRAAFWSAAGAATAWKIVSDVFSWYIKSGISRYEVVYGSLGAVAALMFLIYIISWITLFGAHLSAAIQHWINRD
jgi:membrane protein